MLKAFQDYIKENQLLSPGAKVLVALSGGVDSMVLAYLLQQSGFDLEIAHCHFGLRGTEADLDQQAAKTLALQWNIPFHTIKFDTYHFAHHHKISIQMAARRLRYQWFQQVLKERGCEALATAHHLDDQVETQVLNLIRGTGFAGLRGMKNKRGVLIRPLLFATRKEIESYAQSEHLQWREDASNQSLKYKRNYIRHKLLPSFEKLNPAYREAFAKLQTHADWAEKALAEKRFFFQKKCLSTNNEKLLIYLMKWHSLSESEFFLKQILPAYGFHVKDIGQLFKYYPPQTGTTLHSKSHKLLVNRDHWLVYPATEPENTTTYILQGDRGRLENELFSLNWEVLHEPPFPEPIKSNREATLNLPSHYQELSLRFWQEGDRFVPLGMKGEKKLSDFFIDLKIDRNEKDRIPLLCVDENIAWVCGYRLADPYKLTNSPQKVLWVQFEPRS